LVCERGGRVAWISRNKSAEEFGLHSLPNYAKR
jgi:hypothetical protein